MKKYILILSLFVSNILLAQTKQFNIIINIEKSTVTFQEDDYKEVVELTLVDFIDFTTEKKTCLKLSDGRIIYHTVLNKNDNSYVQKWDLLNAKKEKDNCNCVYDYRFCKRD